MNILKEKNIYKKWWFWALIIVILYIIIKMLSNTNKSSNPKLKDASEKVVEDIVEDNFKYYEEKKEGDELEVVFIAINGSEKVITTLLYGELLEEPEAPKKSSTNNTAYEFSHWATHNKSIDGSEKFDFSQPLTDSITLFAHYKERTISAEEKSTKKDVDKPKNLRTKENYDKIKNGMTIQQVIDILGQPSSTSESEIEGLGKTELFIYHISMSTGCQIYFNNGKVYMKYWTEL